MSYKLLKDKVINNLTMVEQTICRLCLLTDNTAIDVHNEIAQKIDLEYLLLTHFALTVNKYDNLPALICNLCINKIKDFHAFYETVMSNQKLLANKSAENEHILKLKEIVTEKTVLQEVTEDEREHDDNNYSTSDCDIKSIPKNLSKKIKKINKKKKYKDLSLDTEIVVDGKPVQDGKKLDAQIRDFFKLECDLCSERPRFQSFRLILSHYKLVHGIPGYVTCCDKKFFRRCRVLYHLTNHLQPDAYKCKICGKVLSGKATLALHMDVHIPNEERPLKCPECPLRFVRRQYLHQHKITHLSPEQKKHVCEECGKAFGLKSILLTHKKSVHIKYKEHICDVCAKSFKTKDSLVKHRHTHDEDGLFRVQCQQCEAWLKNSGCLRAHTESVHRGGTFPCSQCGKLSPSKRALRVHEKYVHSNVKPYTCTMCPKEFKKRGELREHTASHTGEVLYRCPYCPSTFAANSNFSSHKKKMHSNEIIL